MNCVKTSRCQAVRSIWILKNTRSPPATGTRPATKGFITALNIARKNNLALQLYDNLHFHHADHPDVIIYSKVTPDHASRILVIINLNASQISAGMVHLDMGALGLMDNARYRVEDLLHGSMYEWQGADNYVSLDPNGVSMHLFRVTV